MKSPSDAHNLRYNSLPRTFGHGIVFSWSIYHSHMPVSSRGALGAENDVPRREVDFTSNLPESAPRTPRPTGRHGRPPRPNAIIVGSPDIRTSRSRGPACRISTAGATKRFIHGAVLSIILHHSAPPRRADVTSASVGARRRNVRRGPPRSARSDVLGAWFRPERSTEARTAPGKRCA